MKNLFKATLLNATLAGLLLSVAAAPAFASSQDIRAADRSVQFEVGATNLRYGENDGAQNTFDTEKGWMPSVDVGATWVLPTSNNFYSDMYLQLNAQLSAGQTNYVGALQLGGGGTTPFNTTTDNEIYHISGRVGHFFAASEGVAITPFIDLGFRGWKRNISGRGVTINSDENYTNGEGMGGVLVQLSPFQKFVLSIEGSGGATIGPQMATDGNTFPLQSEAVWHLGARAGYAFTPRFEWIADVSYDGFGFGQSAIVNGSLEPDSYTHELSVMTGLSYHLQ